MSSRTQQDDAKGNSLVKAFKRLGFGSPKDHRKPLPPPPPRPSNEPTAASLPPYLAHLAGPSSVRPAPVSFPEPKHHRYHARPVAQGSHHLDSDSHSVDPKRLPPRPPAFITEQPLAQGRIPNEHPISLKPGPIRVQPVEKLAYPWELVPQPRPPSTRPDSAPGRPEKENTPPATSFAHVDLVTPPRKQHARITNSSALGSLTPNGSQKDAARAPVRGQCWGIKKDGSRCTRKVRSPGNNAGLSPKKAGRRDRGTSAPPRLNKGASAADALIVDDSDSDTGSPRARSSAPARKEEIDEVYCFQHTSEVNKTTGFYPSPGHFVTFSDWFDTHPHPLSDHTQALLRKCMSRPLTPADAAEVGYLYIYELRDRSSATHLCLKVGRTVNVFRRLGQWRSQCQSKDPLLRAFHPSQDGQGLISGADSVDAPGVRFSHRWEALVHLELRELGIRVDERCKDCKTRHREVFLIPRSSGGDGFELAQRVVLKWMRFVQMLQ